jgi:hypothetical protein
MNDNVWQSIDIYWITSATFGLVQNWAFDWWHRRRKRRLALEAMPHHQGTLDIKI